MNNFKRRFGRFVVLLGAGALFLFYISDVAKEPDFNLFFIGVIVLIIGIVILRRNRPERVESGRFRLIRNMKDKKKEKEEKKEDN